MYLHENEPEFRQAVLKAASIARVNPEFVAKDYFVFVFLREVSKRYPDIVFKGGTSLSKCHKAIRRFSEDVDLGVEDEHISQGERRKIKRAVVESCSELGLEIANLDETHSRRDYNKYEIELPYSLGAPELKSRLIVETALMTPVSPLQRKRVSSELRDTLSGKPEAQALFDAFELDSFDVNVTSLERSFVDKAYALCDYYLGERSSDRCSRHIYDEFKLMQLVSLDEDMRNLFHLVGEQRRGLPFCVSAADGIDLSDVLDEVIESGYYRSDYKEVTQKLLFESVPYDEAIGSLGIISSFLRGR